MSKNKILIVDDNSINRTILIDMLKDDYDILEAADGTKALGYIKFYGAELSLVLLDLIMPNLNGVEVLKYMRQYGYLDSTPVIMISSEKSAPVVEEIYALGAAEYIVRPFDECTVRQRVKNTIMLYSKQRMLESMVVEQTVERERNTLIMLEVLSHIVEFRNYESGAHVLNIRLVTEKLLNILTGMTNKYNLTKSDIAMISNASALHDIGKISIPESILNKPDKLTPEEFEIMKTHSAVGADMLKKTTYYRSEKLVKVAHDICRWHHERYDGSGYPDGLKGDEIPITAQIVALADVYDALTHSRVYKDALPQDVAVEMILDGKCGAFNPLLLDCLKKAQSELESAHGRAYDFTDLNISHIATVSSDDDATQLQMLAQLEQERKKNRFYVLTSNEILFEYIRTNDTLMISKAVATAVGIPMGIVDPLNNPELLRVVNENDLYVLAKKLTMISPTDGIIEAPCTIYHDDNAFAYTAFILPLWSNGNRFDSVIGKLVKRQAATDSIFKNF